MGASEITRFPKGSGFTLPIPSNGTSVKSEIRATRSDLIGSKGRQRAPSRYFTLDGRDGAAVPSSTPSHTQTQKATPASYRQVQTRVASPAGLLTSLPRHTRWTPPAGFSVPSHSRIKPATTPARAPLDQDSHSVSRGVNERASLLTVQQEWSPIKAMRWCVRGLLNGGDVTVRSEGQNLSVGGVALCRNPLCPWCSHKRSMESAEVLSKGLIRAKKKGYFARMLTLTIPSGGDYAEQRSLLSRALRRFSKRASKEFKRQGAQHFGLSWSFDLTMKVEKWWRTHLHIHSVMVASSGSVSESTLFDWWQQSVSKEAGHPVTLSRRAFYARSPHSEKSVSAYVLGKFLRSALEVQGSSQKEGGKVGGGLGWRDFLRYIKSTGDVGAGMLYKDIISANKGKWWSSIGQTIRQLALEEEKENPSSEDADDTRQVEVVEVEVYGRDWSVLGRMTAGIATLLYVIQNRDKEPDRFAFVRGWIEKMKASKWLTDQEIEDAWRVALGV